MKKYNILICGESYHGLSFEEREKVRERLRELLAQAGIKLIEYIWVWDDSDRAQLLFHQCNNLQEAKYWIKFLIKQGFHIRIVEETS